jgi:hypothetical protein
VLGNGTAINGRMYSVGSVETISLMAAQGELPKLPGLGDVFSLVELRSSSGEVVSIDYSTQPPTLSRGVAVQLEALQLTGLRDIANMSGAGGQELKGQQFACPNCGSQVHIRLEKSQSISCGSCNSVIDLSRGLGQELKHALQDEPVRPLIPLGSRGLFASKNWQVVGFQHRVGKVLAHQSSFSFDPEDIEDDELFGWDEYLLYNQKEGFQFLVDATDGWSLVKPLTAAPESTTGRQVKYQGASYTRDFAYNAETTYVAGEFYWRVERGQKTYNEDYSFGRSILSREQSASATGEGKEITWSLGTKLDYLTVVSAFRLKGVDSKFRRDDVMPLSTGSSISLSTWITIIVVCFIIFSMLPRCSSRECDPQRENCSSYRSSGGSYGGYSGGGGHK